MSNIEKEKAAMLGRAGEEFVARYIKKHGCIVIKRNWRDERYGEIDIIGEDSENIFFVEVKTRVEGALVSGLEAIDANKLRRTKNAAEMFVQKLNTELSARVDVAEVTAIPCGDNRYKFKMKYIKSVC